MQQLFNVLSAKHYSERTIRNYIQEMRFIFAHYQDVLPASLARQGTTLKINQGLEKEKFLIIGKQKT